MAGEARAGQGEEEGAVSEFSDVVQTPAEMDGERAWGLGIKHDDCPYVGRERYEWQQAWRRCEVGYRAKIAAKLEAAEGGHPAKSMRADIEREIGMLEDLQDG